MIFLLFTLFFSVLNNASWSADAQEVVSCAPSPFFTGSHESQYPVLKCFDYKDFCCYAAVNKHLQKEAKEARLYSEEEGKYFYLKLWQMFRQASKAYPNVEITNNKADPSYYLLPLNDLLTEWKGRLSIDPKFANIYGINDWNFEAFDCYCRCFPSYRPSVSSKMFGHMRIEEIKEFIQFVKNEHKKYEDFKLNYPWFVKKVCENYRSDLSRFFLWSTKNWASDKYEEYKKLAEKLNLSEKLDKELKKIEELCNRINNYSEVEIRESIKNAYGLLQQGYNGIEKFHRRYIGAIQSLEHVKQIYDQLVKFFTKDKVPYELFDKYNALLQQLRYKLYYSEEPALKKARIEQSE